MLWGIIGAGAIVALAKLAGNYFAYEADKKANADLVTELGTIKDEAAQNSADIAADFTDDPNDGIISPYEQKVLDYETKMAAVKAEADANFAKVESIFEPFITSGTTAAKERDILAGIAGPEAQRAAIEKLATNPEYRAMVEQGETALTQNASATGGLRGGNTQAALATFRPQMLSQLIEQQYGRLGGIVNEGRDASFGLANAMSSYGRDNTSLLSGSAQTLLDMGVGTMKTLAQLAQEANMTEQQYLTEIAKQKSAGTALGGQWVNNLIVDPLTSGIGMSTGLTQSFAPRTATPTAGGGGGGGGGSTAPRALIF